MTNTIKSIPKAAINVNFGIDFAILNTSAARNNGCPCCYETQKFHSHVVLGFAIPLA